VALDAGAFAASTLFSSRPDAEHHDQGDFIMAAHDRRCRVGAQLLLVLAFGSPCLVVGCGGGGGDAAAPVDAAQEKKVQKYMTGYRDQIIADNKAKAKAKAAGKVAEKQSP
jgi:3-deoxy-D-arabino-heptulosonate 7-phosphate (DAHP) synthase class II